MSATTVVLYNHVQQKRKLYEFFNKDIFASVHKKLLGYYSSDCFRCFLQRKLRDLLLINGLSCYTSV